MTDSTNMIIEKIKKLLNLSKSHVNLNEAISAAGKAQELMVKYNLTHEMISEATGRKRESEIVDSFRDQHRFLNCWPFSDWHAILASMLCEASHCRCYIATVHPDLVSYEASSPQRAIAVVGFDVDVEFVFSLFPWFASEIDRLVILNGVNQTNDWKENFRLGANKKLGLRLQESRKNVENEFKVLLEDKNILEKANFAIIALDNRLNKIDEHMKEIDLKEGQKKNVLPEGMDAFKIGFDKADEINLMDSKKISKSIKIGLLES